MTSIRGRYEDLGVQRYYEASRLAYDLVTFLCLGSLFCGYYAAYCAHFYWREQEQGGSYSNPHFPTLKEVLPTMLDQLLGPLMPLHAGLLDLCCGAGEFTLIFQARLSVLLPLRLST